MAKGLVFAMLGLVAAATITDDPLITLPATQQHTLVLANGGAQLTDLPASTQRRVRMEMSIAQARLIEEIVLSLLPQLTQSTPQPATLQVWPCDEPFEMLKATIDVPDVGTATLASVENRIATYSILSANPPPPPPPQPLEVSADVYIDGKVHKLTPAP